jgi:endonuclease YncB( thermonuclease family)
MQREQERSRLTVDGRRTDDGDRCTLLVVQERTGSWVFYPHGAAQLGVRIAGADAGKLAQAIQADGSR